MSNPYVPISCSMHDKLLDLATRRRSCELLLKDDVSESTRQPIEGVIVDVFSRDGAEYLRLDNDALIRLDEIATVNGEPVLPA